MRELLAVAVGISGLFTLTLGVVHSFMPILLDFERAIPATGEPLKSLRLGPIRYATTRGDVRGIAWVMNHAASYVLVSIGVADVFWWKWSHGGVGIILSLWVAGWWLVRAATQFYLGRRRGDLQIAAGFSALSALHVLAAVAS